jgi:hypothetical protein
MRKQKKNKVRVAGVTLEGGIETLIQITPEEKKMTTQLVPLVVETLAKNKPLVETLVKNQKDQPPTKEGWYAYFKRNISNGFFYIMGQPALVSMVMVFLVYLKRYICEALRANRVVLLDSSKNDVVYDFILRYTPNILQSVLSKVSQVIQNPFVVAAGSALLSYYGESIVLALLGGGKNVEDNNMNKNLGRAAKYAPAVVMLAYFVFSGCQGATVEETSAQYASRFGPKLEGSELELEKKVDNFLQQFPLGVISADMLSNMGKKADYDRLLQDKLDLKALSLRTKQQERYYRILRFFFNDI